MKAGMSEGGLLDADCGALEDVKSAGCCVKGVRRDFAVGVGCEDYEAAGIAG